MMSKRHAMEEAIMRSPVCHSTQELLRFPAVGGLAVRVDFKRCGNDHTNQLG